MLALTRLAYGQIQQQQQQQQLQQQQQQQHQQQQQQQQQQQFSNAASANSFTKQRNPQKRNAGHTLPQITSPDARHNPVNTATQQQQLQLQAQQQKAAARAARQKARAAGPDAAAAAATIEFTLQGGKGSDACGVCSIKGHKPGNPNWINQDNYSIEECVGGDPETRIYIVLDGHGEHGHLVSTRCHDNLPKYLMSTEYNAKRSNAMMQVSI